MHEPREVAGTIVDTFRQHVAQDPTRSGFEFIDYVRGHEARTQALTLSELDSRAVAIANELQRFATKGDRALLLYRPGLEFVAAFVGCLYAGVVAVPSPLPRQGVGAERLKSIAADCSAGIVLCTESTRSSAEAALGDSSGLRWLCTETIAAADADTCVRFVPSAVAGDTALLQYSSGSTGDPKGVVITHRNLAHHCTLLGAELGFGRKDVSLSWLPTYHDMGLVTGVVLPLGCGTRSVMMAPESFVLRPERWLQAIHTHRATFCAAPDFAYDLCIRKIDDEALEGIDLSSLRIAVSGAEPIRSRTIVGFNQRFAAYGLGQDVLLPAYGLAEATLLVSGRGAHLRMEVFDMTEGEGGVATLASAPGEGARTLVSSGRAYGDTLIRIVDPDSGDVLPERHTGEIWISGGSVGAGYWGRDEAGNAAFSAHLPDDPARTFLRTGDLGFLHNGELFVRGRLKDLILIRGANHHAPDIEATIEASHEAIAKSCGAAFAVDVDDEEQLIVVYEVERDAKRLSEATLAGIAAGIRQDIVENHQVDPHAILLMAGGVPKTSSGKVRRLECCSRYMRGVLKPLHAWRWKGDTGAPAEEVDVQAPATARVADCERWLLAEIASISGMPADRLGIAMPIKEVALDSTAMLALVRAIERHYALLVSPPVLLEQETLKGIAEYVATMVGDSRPAAPSMGGRLESSELDFQMDRQGQSEQADLVAIVGIACRFPSANDPRQFWENLCAGLDSVTDVPPERWDNEALYDPNPLALGKMNTRRGGFLRDLELFDRRFFAIQAREAIRMDPAHRLLLELGWEALEDAGITSEQVSGRRVGVYIGISGSDYAQLQFGDEMLSDAYAGVGCALTNAASRISHFLNLRGPAMAVDTACSSSLSSIHLGCMAIRSGECEMALAGGVNIILSPTVTMSLSKAGMMAPDGRCKTFDGSADGYVRSEGAGLVLMKPLSKAMADGDMIYAVVRGSASNQDGKSSGISAPNGEAQQRVVLAACESARIEPGLLDYIEAHGTGTALGDPIEVNALGEVLKIGAEAGKVYGIGSVKTNIGHAESAAGVASVIKASMILQHRQVPASLNFETPNPLIPFEKYNIRVQQELAPLPDRGRPALVGVNSFGIGGTNVHFVLEEHTAAQASADRGDAASTPRPMLLPLSARSERSLKDAAEALADHLESNPGLDMGDVAHTLAVRRTRLDHRLSVVGDDGQELVAALRGFAQQSYHPNAFHTQPGRSDNDIAFVFSGQGAQWWAMGRELFAKEPVYRAVIEQCDLELAPHTGWSLKDLLMAEEAESMLGETRYAQPALFALQVGLARLLESMGVVPDVVVGHSLGEVAAAHVAGAFSLAEACQLIAIRAELMQEVTGKGLMASVELERAELADLLIPYGDALTIAASNGPTTTVVSGDAEAVRGFLETLQKRNVTAVLLPVNYAFHSAQMEPARRELVSRLAFLRPQPTTIPYFSTVTASLRDRGDLLDAEYWGRNVRQEVRFAGAIEAIAATGRHVFVEIGPNPVLNGAISRILNSSGGGTHTIATLERGQQDQRAIMRCLAALQTFSRGTDWRMLLPGGRFVRGLPHYRWDRQRYWMEGAHHEARDRLSKHPLVTSRMPTAKPTWQSQLDTNVDPYVAALRIRGASRLALGLYVEMALEAVSTQSEAPVSELDTLAFAEPIRLGDSGEMPTLQSAAAEESRGAFAVQISAQLDSTQGKARNWLRTFDCRAHVGPQATPLSFDLDTLRQRSSGRLSAAETYRKLSEVGAEYDPARHVADEIWMMDQSVLLSLRIASLTQTSSDRYHLHPLLFEAMEQAARLAGGSDVAQLDPAYAEKIRFYGATERATHAYARAVATTSDAGHSTGLPHVDVWLLDANGMAVASIEGLTFRAHANENDDQFHISDDIREWQYIVDWRDTPQIEVPESAPQDGSWLIFGDQTGVGDGLAARLRQEGRAVTMVRAGDAFERLSDEEFVVPAGCVEDMARLVDEAFVARATPCLGIVHLWSLDASDASQTDADRLVAEQSLSGRSALHVVRSVANANLITVPRLWIVTRGVHTVVDGDTSDSLAQSLVWGVGKGLVLEHAELRCARVDLEGGAADGAATDREILQLHAELLADGLADQIAFRGGRRYLATLAHRYEQDEDQEEIDPMSGGVFTVAMGEAQAWELQPAKRHRPRAGELELRVEMVRLAGDACDGRPAWRHVVGTVLRSGDGGDTVMEGRVLACVPASSDSHPRVRRELVVALPDTLSPADALASVPAYVTALFALRDVARAARGFRVLLRVDNVADAAAAVNVVRSLGAKAYVAAPVALHAALSDLRIEHVFDEREPSAARDLRRIVGNDGVDMLVNFAQGLERSTCAQALKEFGSCVDVSDADAQLRPLSLARFPGNLTLSMIDTRKMLESDPARVGGLLQEVVDRVADGSLKAMSSTVNTLDAMVGGHGAVDAQDRTGLVAFPPPPSPDVDRVAATCRADATYIVTGGLGGLGLKVVERLVAEGARNIAIFGRSGPSLAALDILEGLSARGADCRVMAVDVSDGTMLADALDEVRRSMPPIRGVIHAAGILDNGIITQMEDQQFDAVMPAKVAGGWNLHRATMADPVDFFVMFSSLASFLGSPGQANYAAANAFLEALASHRAAAGLPGLAIAWGPWADVGMAADVHNLQRLQQHGMGMVRVDSGLDLLFDNIADQTQGAIGALPMNWHVWGKTRPNAARLPYFASLVPASAMPVRSHARITAQSLVGRTPDQQLDELRAAVLRAVCQSMMLDPDGVDLNIPLTAIGLDSIVALELKDRIESAIEVVVRTSALVGGRSIRILAEQFRDEMLLAVNGAAAEEVPASVVDAASDGPVDGIDGLDELSQEEIEALLLDLETDSR